MRVFVTGDKHGDFRAVFEWLEKVPTSTDDVMIVAGDAGINFHYNMKDTILKQKLAACPITFIFLHGNHEARPRNIRTYKQTAGPAYRGIEGVFFYEEEYPNLLFAESGIFWINGRRWLFLDGAYSIDKDFRIDAGLPWWPDEQMSGAVKEDLYYYVREHPEFDYVLSHAAPTHAEPLWAFQTWVDQSKVDTSTPEFLETIYELLDKDRLNRWFFGHYHEDAFIDPQMLAIFNDIREVEPQWTIST